ncbi:diaminopimelate decarboxylase [Solibacillus kalamii]|uniref:Diaminopimelate decarboxylase n=2 Tax=Solibacillus TaxID=648800 RepID=F2FAN9_SOLSS|nr:MULTISPECIES: diaminopimelate decarboxylase [Solibacillus]MBM7666470.1 diaminopimelate decarboxylase [Solibacillus kalamii]OBW56596.1 diaminopimelate decarboxylase [Solibacillus silvestris]OUZ37938.1 diaminopimelate decarboxylase [Solibacillus kalamii]BAK17205.1 diaminopimelate decarboxylase [Solibacillus silvestris StLB046]
MHLYGTQQINELGHLTIGGVDTIELAKQYGTPLFVYDTALIRKRSRGFIDTFEQLGVKAQVAYASKAFACVAAYQLAAQENLSLDVVSGGELYTAIKAGFPADRIHFHGNNKSIAELELAFETGIGCIVVDNFYEISLIKEIAQQKNQKMKILLRVTPGVEAHTHDFITTGQADSKFGFDLNNGQADEAFKQVVNDEHIELLGLHCHIGSQIFETEGFSLAAGKVMQKMGAWKEQHGFVAQVLNLGGGFGIRYTEEDKPLEPHEYVADMIRTVQDESKKLNLAMPEIWIEPGRSLVGDAGTSLYTIGSQKTVPNVRDYIAVDGGMSDNIRPALYDAKYEAIIANKANDPKTSTYTVAGKLCESGDKLIIDASLQNAHTGDILAMFCTGAYGYSMASNYNRVPRPAVVFVENGEHQLAIKRESYEDLVVNDLPLTLTKGE